MRFCFMEVFVGRFLAALLGTELLEKRLHVGIGLHELAGVELVNVLFAVLLELLGKCGVILDKVARICHIALLALLLEKLVELGVRFKEDLIVFGFLLLEKELLKVALGFRGLFNLLFHKLLKSDSRVALLSLLKLFLQPLAC